MNRERGQVQHDPVRVPRLGLEQALAKLLVTARVTRAGDQYDCCVSSLLEPNVERLVEEVMLSHGGSFRSSGRDTNKT